MLKKPAIGFAEFVPVKHLGLHQLLTLGTLLRNDVKMREGPVSLRGPGQLSEPLRVIEGIRLFGGYVCAT
jgi:hypothetical protein